MLRLITVVVFVFISSFILINFFILINLVYAQSPLGGSEGPTSGPDFSLSAPSFTERDYMTLRNQQFFGVIPTIGEVYGVTTHETGGTPIVTFVMRRDTSLYLEVRPIHPGGKPRPDQIPVSILMLVSEASAPRLLKQVWGSRDLRESFRFWTSRYWVPVERCTGAVKVCPRIQFRATNGSAFIIVLNKRANTPRN